MSGTLKQQLQQIADTKQAIANAINSKGIEVSADDNFASYANKISQIEGGGSGTVAAVGSAFNFFDTKVADHILEGNEALGWELQGTTIKAKKYPEFYEKCLQQYKESELHKVCCVNLIGNVVNDNGILSNFSEGNFARIKPIDLRGMAYDSWEIVVKFKLDAVQGVGQHLINSSKSNKYVAIVVTATGKLVAAIGNKDGSEWQTWDDGKDTYAGKTVLTPDVWYWTKLQFNGQQYTLSLSTDGNNYTTEFEYQSTVRPYFKDDYNFNIGIDRNNKLCAVNGQIDLNDCYIKTYEQIRWCGCIDVYKHANGHMFYPISNKHNIDGVFNYCGMAWFYGIDEDNKQIVLPRNICFEQMSINDPGEFVAAGIPNIEGQFEVRSQTSGSTVLSIEPLFTTTTKAGTNNIGAITPSSTKYNNDTVQIDASNTNVVFGNSSTVQPNAVKKLLYICVGNTGIAQLSLPPVDIIKSNNDLFDIKISDGINNKAGWAAQGSTITSTQYPDFYEICKQEFLNGQKVYASSNVTKQGSLKDNNGVISNFSEHNTATIPCFNTTLGACWEIVVKFNLNTVGDDVHIMSASLDKNIFAICINNKKISCAIGSTSGDSWKVSNLDITETQTLQANQDYWAKLEFTGGAYILSLSTDGVMYEQQYVLESYNSLYYDENCLIRLGANRNDASKNIVDGCIDLNQCYISLNGNLFWQGVNHKVTASSGREYNGTSYQIDIENETITLPVLDNSKHIYFCVGDTQNKVNVQNAQLFDRKRMECIDNDPNWALSGSKIYRKDNPEFFAKCCDLFASTNTICEYLTIVGKPTINGSDVSDFSSNNYIKTNNIELNDNFEIRLKFTTTTTNCNIFNLFNGISANTEKSDCYLSIGGTSTDKGYLGYNVGDGATWFLTQINKANQGCTKLEDNTTYYLKFTYDGAIYKSWLSKDNEQWTLDWSFKSTAIVPSCSFALGVSRQLSTYSNVILHLDECYVKKDDQFIIGVPNVYYHANGMRFYDVNNVPANTANLYGMATDYVILPKYEDYTYICVKAVKPHNTSCFNMFDIKHLDRKLTSEESQGWKSAGSKVFKSEYPDFYNKCLEEYLQSVDAKEYIKHNVTLKGDLQEKQGILTGFSVTDYALTSYTIPSTIKSFEIVGSIKAPDRKNGVNVLYGQQTSNMENPQSELDANATPWCGASFSKSAWDVALNDADIYLGGKKVWIKFTWNGTTYKAYYSYDGIDFICYSTKASTKAPTWQKTHAIGWDANANIALNCALDLKDYYININGERVWDGCVYASVKKHANGHTFYDAKNTSEVDFLYDTFGKLNAYGIDTQAEYVILPKLEDNTYYCVGNTEVGTATIDVSRSIELNNPFFIGMSQYFENEPNNISWLKSTGEFHSKEVYPAFYNWCVDQYNKQTPDFVLHTDEITDYSYVINLDEETFRLPLLNGSESLLDTTRYIEYPINTEFNTAPANGYVFVEADTGTANNQLGIIVKTSNGAVYGYKWQANTGGTNQLLTAPVRKGYTFQFNYTTFGQAPYYRFYYNKGNGSLYYYVGEAVNNAHLVNIGNITAELSNKIGPQSDKLEGHFVATPPLTIAESQSIDTTTKIFDVSEYLPQDSYEYLVWVTGAVSTTASSSKYVNLHIGSDLMGSTYCTLCGTTARSAYSYVAYGSACIPVGKDRRILRYGNTSGSGTYTISLRGYRRMGN